MRRRRKQLQTFQRPTPGEVIGEVQLWYMPKGENLLFGFSAKDAPRPDWFVQLNRANVESIVAHFAAFLMRIDIEDLKALKQRILSDFETAKNPTIQ